ncbi:MAG: hypothetical protein Q9165_006094 [Trypethelium subeluteriae]
MTSKELVLFKRSGSPSKSVGLLGLTAVLGSQAVPTIAPYAKELFYRLLLTIIERLFRSVESLAVRYLRLDAEANAGHSLDEQPEAKLGAESEPPKKPKTIEMLEDQDLFRRIADGALLFDPPHYTEHGYRHDRPLRRPPQRPLNV